MDLGLTDSVAFVAGSSRGIGEGIARSFLGEGARTVITGRDAASLEHTKTAMAREFGADKLLAIQGDLGEIDTVRSALETTIAHFGTLDCVVINVGSGKSIPGWDVPEQEWHSVFERNLWTSIRIAQESLRLMIPQKRGSIVFISSIAGIAHHGAPLAYSAAKAALTNYAANLATLAAPHGIRVNCVAPGNIVFPGGSWEKRMEERGPEMREFIAREVPQNRLGTPQEIGDVVTFLSSPRASFVTGACWIADGGQTRTW